jgi:hypothetical protein
MNYFERIETIVLSRCQNGLVLEELKVLKKMDGTYSTEKCFETTLFKVIIRKYTVDGLALYICTPERESNPECFQIEFKDIVELNGISFVSAEKILSYLYKVGLEKGFGREIKHYFKLQNTRV